MITDTADEPTVEVDQLSLWLDMNLPGAGRPGETSTDTAIRILATIKATMPFIVRVVVGQIIQPLVSVLRENGLELLPDGLTIPPATPPEAGTDD
jgi:hypothetical protein